MSKIKFEACWRDGFDVFERVFIPEYNKSFKRKLNNSKSEWFEEVNYKTEYSLLLDENTYLVKKEGKASDGKIHYGFQNPIGKHIRDNYWDKENSYNNDANVWYLDIETRSGTVSKGFPEPDLALEPISLIQIYDKKNNIIIVLGLREWKHENYYKDKIDCGYKYIYFDNEVQLIENFLKIFKKLDPLIIHAWNGLNFDFPYIINRMQKLGLDINSLSNYGKVQMYKNNYGDNVINSDGHFFMDMIPIYKKFVMEVRSSYSLENIAQIELNESKVQHSEYVTFDDFYTGKYVIPLKPTLEQKNSRIYQEAIKGNTEEVKELAHSEFVYYGFKDVIILRDLDKKLNFTNLLLLISHKTGTQPGEVLGTVAPWSQFLSNIALKQGKVGPKIEEKPKPHIKGGFCMEPIVGKYKWVLSEDVSSMYPLLSMVGSNISPETWIPFEKLPLDLKNAVEKYKTQDEMVLLNTTNEDKLVIKELLEKYNYTMSANGAIFRKDFQGILPKLVFEIYNQRKIDKKTMINYEKVAVKIDNIIKNNKYKSKDTIDKNSINLLDLLKDDSILYNLTLNNLQELYQEARNKEEFFNVSQMMQKNLMNSVYGAFGNRYFQYFNEEIAEAITANGRYFIRFVARNVENKLQKLYKNDRPYIIYSDTDSFYFHIEPFMEKIIDKNPNLSLSQLTDIADKFEKEHIYPIVQDSINVYAEDFNIFDASVIGMDREAISDRAVFLAKKKYFMRLQDMEGVRYSEDNPEYKTMGIEMAKSSTPKWCRQKFEDVIPIILDKNEEDIIEWIKEIRNEFIEQNIVDISYTGTVNNLDYKLNIDKGIPIGSRASIVYNEFIKNNGLDNRFNTIKESDKVQRIFLIEDNPFDSNVISYNDERFIEDYREFIDYDKAFEKYFMDGLKLMTKPLNYILDRKVDILDVW